jgi:predicted RNA-binding Zn-ribbon protein involved in translation (DUF1610 family)
MGTGWGMKLVTILGIVVGTIIIIIALKVYDEIKIIFDPEVLSAQRQENFQKARVEGKKYYCSHCGAKYFKSPDSSDLYDSNSHYAGTISSPHACSKCGRELFSRQ